MNEINESAKYLKKLDERLMTNYDVDALPEIQRTLENLKKPMKTLEEKLENRDRIIEEVVKSPSVKTKGDYIIQMIYLFETVKKALNNTKEVIAGLNEDIEKCRNDPYIENNEGTIRRREIERATAILED
jgi:hypothetical protein